MADRNLQYRSILINNIAWLLRRFPIFAISVSGNYRLQPVFVEDLAEIAVSAGYREDNVVMDAVGREVFAYGELAMLIARNINSRAKIVCIRPWMALQLAKLIGCLVGNMVITKDEIDGLMSNLLISDGPPTGHTRLSDWLEQNGNSVGAKYFPI